ncbi:MAG: TldD/PmbA family protein [Syntrophomonadaceae bacterium]|nr:TldD/PmbA family protein [Syntrophomonadaceae bacterium]
MIAKDVLKEVLSAALSNGGDFADIFVERRRTSVVFCEDNRIERVNTGLDVGAGIRVIQGENTAYAYTNDLSKTGLNEAARIASHAVKGENKDLSFDLRTVTSPVELKVAERPEAVKIDRKVDEVEKANQVARAVDPRIRQVAVSYGDVVQKVVMANSEGRYVEDERIRTRFVVNAVAAEGSVIQTGYEAVGGHVGYELFKEKGASPEQVAEAAARRALLMLGARPAPAGRMPVVMSGEAGGTMVHEACGHGLEADAIQKQLSVYAGKVGQLVASELVSVVDDATLSGKYGSFRFDDEGVPGQRKILIDHGELKGFMYDGLTARKEGRTSTGNGRRESFHHRPLPRMTNTYIKAGQEDPEKIIRDTRKGLLVKKMGGGQVNTVNGDFVFDVSEGYLIQDGEIGAPVRGATLTGNGPEVLRIVERVGKDLGFGIGTCGKDGQGVPVSDAQPTLSIRELVVGGVEIPMAPNGNIRRL